MNRRALAHLAVGKNNPLLLQNVIRYQIYESMDAKEVQLFRICFRGLPQGRPRIHERPDRRNADRQVGRRSD